MGDEQDPESLLAGLDFDDLFDDDFTGQTQPAGARNGALVAFGGPPNGSQVPGGRPPEDLHSVLQTKEGEIAILRANTEKQARMIEALRSQLEAKEQEVAASQMQLSDGLSHELENMRTQLAFRDREVEELEGEVKRHKREREAQQRQAETIRGQQAALQQELDRLRSALAAAQQNPQPQSPKEPHQPQPQTPPPPLPAADTTASTSAHLLLGDLLGPATGPGQQGTLVGLTQTLCAATSLAPDTKPRLLTVVAEGLRQLGTGQGQSWLLLLGLCDTMLQALLHMEDGPTAETPGSLQPITQLAPRKRPRLATPTATPGAAVLVCRDWALLAEVLALLRRLLGGCPEACLLLATHMRPTMQPPAQPPSPAGRVALRVAQGRIVLGPAGKQHVQQQGAEGNSGGQEHGAQLAAEVGATLLALLAWTDPTHQVPTGVVVLVLQCLACTANACPGLADLVLAPHGPALARLCLRAAQAEGGSMDTLLLAGLQLLTSLGAQQACTAQMLASHVGGSGEPCWGLAAGLTGGAQGVGGTSCMLGHMAGMLACLASGHGAGRQPRREMEGPGSGWQGGSMGGGWQQALLAVRLLGVAWCSMGQWPAGPCGCQQDTLRGLVDVLDRCCAAYMGAAEWQQGGASGRVVLVNGLGPGLYVLLEGVGLLGAMVAADQLCLAMLARVGYTYLSAMRRLAALFAGLAAAIATAPNLCASSLVEQMQLAEQQASDLANHLDGDVEGEAGLEDSME